MIVGGKSKYVCLLSLIKNESKALYKIVDDLCLDQMFRSQKYKNTFLMPNTALIKHIEKLVEEDEDAKAIDIIRSLFLKGHLEKSAFTKDAKIGTLQYSPSVLSHPEEVAKEIKESKKSIITTRSGAHATVIYEYKSDSPPKTTGGKSGGLQLVGAVSGGAHNDKKHEMLKELTLSMIIPDKVELTKSNFMKAVNLLLHQVKQESGEEKLKHAAFFLDNNIYLSWIFLTMPGRTTPFVEPSQETISKIKSHVSLPPSEMFKERLDADIDHAEFRKVKSSRQETMEEDITTIQDKIVASYKKQMEEYPKVKEAYSCVKGCAYLKILVDELRFAYGDDIQCITKEKAIREMFDHLLVINWDEPDAWATITSEQIKKSLKLCRPEFYESAIVGFVKSAYFCYLPMNDSIRTLIGNNMKGGNPNAIKTVIFSGGQVLAESLKGGVCVKEQLQSMFDSFDNENLQMVKSMIEQKLQQP